MSVMANSTERSVTSKSDTSLISILVIAVVVLILILLLAVILRYMYKHKGTYHTNEAKGTEFAETADTALRGDPALQDAIDESKKEYFI
ncbi:glycophorin-C-like isoform X2 [Sinocyclocheilus anshuiensis]|uniref:glycophorin-C-like isoform X2 n=1 Tax=Sinocyclocheilus anshuiensis TaxID=1608454 RepID=UPI0007B79D28|nr:PREDICTED: glycophorin-C-like isoform X2 [Sinocyclocheilus anshuiensis]